MTWTYYDTVLLPYCDHRVMLWTLEMDQYGKTQQYNTELKLVVKNRIPSDNHAQYLHSRKYDRHVQCVDSEETTGGTCFKISGPVVVVRVRNTDGHRCDA